MRFITIVDSAQISGYTIRPLKFSDAFTRRIGIPEFQQLGRVDPIDPIKFTGVHSCIQLVGRADKDLRRYFVECVKGFRHRAVFVIGIRGNPLKISVVILRILDIGHAQLF